MQDKWEVVSCNCQKTVTNMTKFSFVCEERLTIGALQAKIKEI